MKRFLYTWPLVILIMIFIVVVLSWIGNVYGWGCRNILSGDGVRWVVSMIMDNFNVSPWTSVVIFTATISIIGESGIATGFNKEKYLRQKRAYQLVAMVFLIVCLSVLIFFFLPGNLLMSAFGTFEHSSLQRGLFPLSAIMLYLLSVIYGYSTGRFFSLSDVAHATVELPKSIAEYFITLFVTSQFVALLLFVFFTDYNPAMEIPAEVRLLSACLYWIPWMLHVILAFKNKS